MRDFPSDVYYKLKSSTENFYCILYTNPKSNRNSLKSVNGQNNFTASKTYTAAIVASHFTFNYSHFKLEKKYSEEIAAELFIPCRGTL